MADTVGGVNHRYEQLFGSSTFCSTVYYLSAASIIAADGYSFPSGHTTMATAMAFGFYFIFKEKAHNCIFHIVLFMVTLGWSLLIVLTRLYLGVHWFTDVVGGFGLGLWWVTLLQLYRQQSDN